MMIGGGVAIEPRHDLNVEWRTRARSALFALWPVVAVLAFAALFQPGRHLPPDVSWLITLCEKTLDGQRPYIDFIEVNPPASILLYLPAVSVARLIGVKSEIIVSVFCFLAIGASLTLCAKALHNRGFFERVEAFSLTGAAVALAVLPADNFAQREHFAIIAGLPCLAVLIARTNGLAVGAGVRILGGIGAGVMACIKPHFALIVLAPLPFFIWRNGWRALLASFELCLAAVVCAIYIGIVYVFFPSFIHEIVPLVVAVYIPVRYSWTALASSAPFVPWLVLGVYLLALARGGIGRPQVAIPALASCGAMAGYFVQGKGWSYQAYPAVALMVIALGCAMSADKRAIRLVPEIAFVGTIILLWALFAAINLPYLFSWMALLGLVGGALWTLAGKFPPCHAIIERLFALGLASVIAILFVGFMYGDRGDPQLEVAAKSLGNHLKVLAISSDLTVGHPFTRRIGGVWAQRVASLWITGGARRIIADSGESPAVMTRMRPYLALDRDMLVEDIRHNRPDIVLISDRLDKFRAWAFADPPVAAALANYRLYAADGPPGRETFLYARADLLPPPRLQPSLAP